MSEENSTPQSHPATRIAHAGETPVSSATDPLVAPIYQTTVYSYPDLDLVNDVYEGRSEGYIYSRYGMPNHRLLEESLADLEGLESGLATATGMSAITALLFGLMSSGDRIVASGNVYGGTRGLLDRDAIRFGIDVHYVDALDLDQVRSALHHGTRARPAMLYVEGVTNPTIQVHNLAALAELAHEAEIPLVVDSTFATPYHCQPATHGADIVIHSTTKFIAGHNDVSGGIVLGSAGIIERVRQQSVRFGGIGGPFDSWLVLRGLRTLAVRMKQSSANSLALAEALEGHPAITRVRYPGLPSHAHHATAGAMLSHGYGSMLSIDLDGGEELVNRVVAGFRNIRFVETLGGLGTTVVHPATTSHRSLTPDQRAELDISEGLLRFSVGIEETDDLVSEVITALDSAAGR